ncbi:MAG: prepilin-type N-terminal cleavage/methylation domain-containing protein [Gammaproteobacteria bacterium]|nr:prepilin-type N-terminal cleavage/methylation domain-containing protein [Gammaproteobacteria bacterium]
MRKRVTGSTLVELVIVMAIVAVIAAITIPTYQHYLRKSRRVEAMSAIMDIIATQEKYFIANNAYANSMQTLGYPPGDVFTENNYYQLSITGNAARAQAVGAQLADEDCRIFEQAFASGAKTSENADGHNNPAGTCWD